MKDQLDSIVSEIDQKLGEIQKLRSGQPVLEPDIDDHYSKWDLEPNINEIQN